MKYLSILLLLILFACSPDEESHKNQKAFALYDSAFTTKDTNIVNQLINHFDNMSLPEVDYLVNQRINCEEKKLFNFNIITYMLFRYILINEVNIYKFILKR